MSKFHYEVHDEAGLILEGYFWDVDEVMEKLKTHSWLKGKQVQIINASENEIAKIITL